MCDSMDHAKASDLSRLQRSLSLSLTQQGLLQLGVPPDTQPRCTRYLCRCVHFLFTARRTHSVFGMAPLPPYERRTFDPVNLTDIHEQAALLEDALNKAFEEYRAFTERLLADQQAWVAAVREREDSQLPSGEFAEFESEPCMNASPLESIMECIEAGTFPLFIYLTEAAMHACAQNQRLDDIPDGFGEEVMAFTTPPYGWTEPAPQI